MRRAAGLALAAAAVVLGGADASRAAIPGPAKVARAVVDANDVSGRSGPLVFDVKLQIEGAKPSAEGELAVHPSGLARLELRSQWGFVERHLLQSNDYQASRDGELLTDPHPFLPPLFLLQAGSPEALAAALASYGVAEQQLVLGRIGPHDCYVFGGRLVGGGGASGEERLLPSLWIDVMSYDPLRVVRADGVEYRFGPIEVFGRIRFPRWIEIQSPDGLRARLEIGAVSPAEAPAALFQPAWLTDVPRPELPRPQGPPSPAARP